MDKETTKFKISMDSIVTLLQGGAVVVLTESGSEEIRLDDPPDDLDDALMLIEDAWEY